MHIKILTFCGVIALAFALTDGLSYTYPYSTNSLVYAASNFETELPHFNTLQSGFQVTGIDHAECKAQLSLALQHTPTDLISEGLSIELIRDPNSHGSANSQEIRVNCDLPQGQFTYTFFHELGHIHYFSIESQKIENPFANQTPVYSNGIPNYLTEYATTNPHEDFAESFAIYLSNSQLFQEKAQKSPLLQEKYDFIRMYIEG